MKKTAIFTILAVVAFSCAKKPDQKTTVLTINKYDLLVYKRFCFYDGRCTTYSLVEMSEINVTEEDEYTGDKRIYKDVQINRINPAVASDSAVVNQFILSLEAYNNCFGRKNGCAIDTLSMDLYFENENFRDEYNYAFDESNYLKIIGLKELKTFNFGGRIVEHDLGDDNIEIVFEDYKNLKMACSKTYFKETLSMCYINFLTKMSLLTNCYIRLKKVDMKPHSN